MKSSCNNFYSLLFLACTFTLVPQPSYNMNANAVEQIPLTSGHSLLENMRSLAMSKINVLSGWFNTDTITILGIAALAGVSIYSLLKWQKYRTYQRHEDNQAVIERSRINERASQWKEAMRQEQIFEISILNSILRDLWRQLMTKKELAQTTNEQSTIIFKIFTNNLRHHLKAPENIDEIIDKNYSKEEPSGIYQPSAIVETLNKILFAIEGIIDLIKWSPKFNWNMFNHRQDINNIAQMARLPPTQMQAKQAKIYLFQTTMRSFFEDIAKSNTIPQGLKLYFNWIGQEFDMRVSEALHGKTLVK